MVWWKNKGSDGTEGAAPKRTDAGKRSGLSGAGATRRAGRRATATQHSDLGEKLIAGVPARIMRPRLAFIACLVAVCLFGLLMVYSASSVESLKELGSPYYYLIRQGVFMVAGAGIILWLTGRFLPFPWPLFRGLSHVSWLAIIGMLIVVLFVGTGGDSWGASRWIDVGFFTLQPAELAKPAIILLVADLFSSYFSEGTEDTATFLFKLGLYLAIPTVLIMAQPDLGTTAIILVTVATMMFIAGISYRLSIAIIALAILALVVAIVVAPYRMNRFFIALNPWSDPYGNGYQATLAIMAFASGGLFGRGIGNSTMKYHYLPEAHNDYILAIIGEELGFVGTIAFLAVFLLMMYAGAKIAMRAPSFHAQMLAAGATLCLSIQFFLNLLGITGVIPMTGKPMPFISYGGSAVLTSMILAGIILRVSLESNVETAHERRRSRMAVLGAGGAVEDAGEEMVSGYVGRSTAGSARTRSRRRSGGDAAPSRSRGFDVLEGGRSENSARPDVRPSRRGASTGAGRVDDSDSGRSGTYERVNLNGDGSGRLRRDGLRTRVDYHDIAGTAGPRRSGDGRRGGANSRGRNRNDRT